MQPRCQNTSAGRRSVFTVIVIRELCICDASLPSLWRRRKRTIVQCNSWLAISHVRRDICLEWFRSSGYVQHRHVYHREELLARRMSAITMLTASLVHTRIEHVGHRHVVRIVLPVPLIPFARYLVALESAHERNHRVWEREWRHFLIPCSSPASLPFSRENKTLIQWYRVIESGALSATPSYASEFANCAWKKCRKLLQGGGVSYTRLPRTLTFDFRLVYSFFFCSNLNIYLSLFLLRKMQLKRYVRTSE